MCAIASQNMYTLFRGILIRSMIFAKVIALLHAKKSPWHLDFGTVSNVGSFALALSLHKEETSETR